MDVPKVLVLVIYSPSPIYDAQRDFWRRYMHSSPTISAYFITYGQVSEPTLEGDTLIVPGVESYLDITEKTIVSLEYFLARGSYDFVVRSNMSSVWNFQKMLTMLATCPRTNLYCGKVCHDYWNVPHVRPDTVSVFWVGGAGIFFTPDVCQKLIVSRETAIQFKCIDDVDFGYTLQCIGVPITPAERCDIEVETLDIPSGFYHYRIKLPPHVDNRIEKTITLMEKAASFS